MLPIKRVTSVLGCTNCVSIRKKNPCVCSVSFLSSFHGIVLVSARFWAACGEPFYIMIKKRNALLKGIFSQQCHFPKERAKKVVPSAATVPAPDTTPGLSCPVCLTSVLATRSVQLNSEKKVTNKKPSFGGTNGAQESFSCERVRRL